MRDVDDSAPPSVIPEEKPVPADWQLTGLIVLMTSLCVIGLFWTTVRSMMEVWESS